MMILEFLAVGTFWFWALLVLAGFVVSELCDRDRGTQASLVALGTLGALAIFGDFNPFAWAADHPLGAAVAVIIYVATGVAWGVLKWRFHTRTLRRTAEALAAEFLTKRGLPPDAAIPDDENVRRDWRWALEQAGIKGKWPPQVHENKGRILSWMCYWPASLAWTVLDDPLRSAFTAIYNRIGVPLQRISDSAFAGTDRLSPNDKDG